MAFTLGAHIDLSHAPETEGGRYAVRELKTALNRLGWYRPDPAQGMNDDIDDGLRDAVYAYQRKNTVMFGDTNLGPGSTTERLLQGDLAAVDDNALYIWRTVNDDKVRHGHAARSGRTFSWNAPPDGGHPSEDYNCRCWAEPVNPPVHPWMDWVDERRETRFAKTIIAEQLAPPRGINPELITQVPLDAINSTVSPIDLIGFGSSSKITRILLNDVVYNTIIQKINVPSKKNTNLAPLGEKHSGFFKRYENASNEELEKGIRSFEKQINNHLNKLKDPRKEIPNFDDLDLRHQRDLLENKWPNDIQRLKEQREILKGILNERS